MVDAALVINAEPTFPNAPAGQVHPIIFKVVAAILIVRHWLERLQSVEVLIGDLGRVFSEAIIIGICRLASIAVNRINKIAFQTLYRFASILHSHQ